MIYKEHRYDIKNGTSQQLSVQAHIPLEWRRNRLPDNPEWQDYLDQIYDEITVEYSFLSREHGAYPNVVNLEDGELYFDIVHNSYMPALDNYLATIRTVGLTKTELEDNVIIPLFGHTEPNVILSNLFGVSRQSADPRWGIYLAMNPEMCYGDSFENLLTMTGNTKEGLADLLSPIFGDLPLEVIATEKIDCAGFHYDRHQGILPALGLYFDLDFFTETEKHNLFNLTLSDSDIREVFEVDDKVLKFISYKVVGNQRSYFKHYYLPSGTVGFKYRSEFDALE